jgi:two-component system, OmpR family, response regulator RegX3
MIERGRIVVIDDELSLLDLVRRYLERDGYTVSVSATGADGFEAAARADAQLVILDLMLPDMPGEELCRRLRRQSSVPILMLTAKSDVNDRIAGLAAGADDYLVKPFSPRELVLRVHAILRRTDTVGHPSHRRQQFDAGRLVIDPLGHTVELDGVAVPLTFNERALLTTLTRYPGRVYSRGELLDHLQGEGLRADPRTIDAHVKNLRKKIEDDPRRPRIVVTVFGVGYRFGVEPTEDA